MSYTLRTNINNELLLPFGLVLGNKKEYKTEGKNPLHNKAPYVNIVVNREGNEFLVSNARHRLPDNRRISNNTQSTVDVQNMLLERLRPHLQIIIVEGYELVILGESNDENSLRSNVAIYNQCLDELRIEFSNQAA